MDWTMTSGFVVRGASTKQPPKSVELRARPLRAAVMMTLPRRTALRKGPFALAVG